MSPAPPTPPTSPLPPLHSSFTFSFHFACFFCCWGAYLRSKSCFFCNPPSGGCPGINSLAHTHHDFRIDLQYIVTRVPWRRHQSPSHLQPTGKRRSSFDDIASPLPSPRLKRGSLGNRWLAAYPLNGTLRAYSMIISSTGSPSPLFSPASRVYCSITLGLRASMPAVAIAPSARAPLPAIATANDAPVCVCVCVCAAHVPFVYMHKTAVHADNHLCTTTIADNHNCTAHTSNFLCKLLAAIWRVRAAYVVLQRASHVHQLWQPRKRKCW